MPNYKATCKNLTATVEATAPYHARRKAIPIFQEELGRKVEGIEISILPVGPNEKRLTKLQKEAAAGHKVYILKGAVTDPEAHDGRGKLGDPEWSFTADDPNGNLGYSEDYLDLEEGMRNYPGAVFEMWQPKAAESPKPEPVAAQKAEEVDEDDGIDSDVLTAVIRVDLSFVVSHSLHTAVTRESLAELVRGQIGEMSDEDLGRMIDSHSMIELTAEDGAGRRVVYLANSDGDV